SEIDTRLSLLSGDYALAENKCRILETTLDATSATSPGQFQNSPRDKFVSEHMEPLLDRVQSLNHTKKYSQAARLARLLLLVKSKQLYHRTGADSAANLAFSYFSEGHRGLSAAFEEEAEFKDLAGLSLGPSRYVADAKETLAAICETRGNF